MPATWCDLVRLVDTRDTADRREGVERGRSKGDISTASRYLEVCRIFGFDLVEVGRGRMVDLVDLVLEWR